MEVVTASEVVDIIGVEGVAEADGIGPSPPASAIAAFNGSSQHLASFVFPLLFGCTPSPVSVAVL